MTPDFSVSPLRILFVEFVKSAFMFLAMRHSHLSWQNAADTLRYLVLEGV